MEDKLMEEKLLCSHCGALIEDDDYSLVNGEVVCSDCVDNYCCTCNNCGAVIYDSDSHGDEYVNLTWINPLLLFSTIPLLFIPFHCLLNSFHVSLAISHQMNNHLL